MADTITATHASDGGHWYDPELRKRDTPTSIRRVKSKTQHCVRPERISGFQA
jgi:hypothetical protein